MSRWGNYAVLGTPASGVLWGLGTVLGFVCSEVLLPVTENTRTSMGSNGKIIRAENLEKIP